MNLRLIIMLLSVTALGVGGFYGVLRVSNAAAESDHGHSHGEEEKGPNGGSIFKSGDFTAEIALREIGTRSEFYVWFTKAEKYLNPESVKFSITIKRPWGKVESFSFEPRENYLHSLEDVAKPYSFGASAKVVSDGETYEWNFNESELQTSISGANSARSGVKTSVAMPARLEESMPVYGRVTFNTDNVARATPRFAGKIVEIRKRLGDSVSEGETVAVVETNQSLKKIGVISPVGGVVIERSAAVGETVQDGAPIYTVADMRTVWVELNVPVSVHSRVKEGMTAKISPYDGGTVLNGKISAIAPAAAQMAQTVSARIVLDGTDGRLKPGMFVKADVVVGESSVPVAVRESALQNIGAQQCVFTKHGDIYQARPVKTGRVSGGFAEIADGLNAGEEYVCENSYIIKADIEKSSASHEH